MTVDVGSNFPCFLFHMPYYSASLRHAAHVSLRIAFSKQPAASPFPDLYCLSVLVLVFRCLDQESGKQADRNRTDIL